MEKQNKIILGLIIILALAIVGICIYAVTKKDVIEVTDAIKFKEEYESLNGAINENNGKIYPNVEISVDNPIIYKTSNEIIDILNKETAIVYFGFKNCPWCRSMIETLLKAAKENNLSKIYYVNIYDIRDAYVLNENKKVEKTNEGTESYKKILQFMGDSLQKYYLEDEDGKKYDTKTTRLYAPTVIAVKNGKLESIHEGTVDSQEDPYQGLSSDQKDELYSVYDALIDSLEDAGLCQTSEAC